MSTPEIDDQREYLAKVNPGRHPAIVEWEAKLRSQEPAVDVEKELYDALLAMMKSETATSYMQAQRAIKAYEEKGRL